MDEKLFQELESNLKEATRFAKGKSRPNAIYVVLEPAEIKAIREQTNLSQAEFARKYQLSLDTIKGWEQGKRSPDKAATNYLRIIKADPSYVEQMLAA